MSLIEMDGVPGRIRYIWERMYTWMDTMFLLHEYEDYQIEGDAFDIHTTKHYPLVTLGIDPMTHLNETYNRDLGEGEGVLVYYPFTMYVYDYKVNKSGYSAYHDVHLLGDRVLKYLKSRRFDQTEKTTHGIIKIEKLDMEESQPRGIRHVARMIISGRLKVKRYDSP